MKIQRLPYGKLRLMVSPYKIAIIVLVAAFLFPTLSFGVCPVQASTPSGIVYSIPITLTSTQPVATPAPFQQMVVVDSAAYSQYEASNLQNIKFYDSSGNVIPSWLESGSSSSTNTVYWLNLVNGIPAGSTVTVYMGFATPGVNLFNAQTTGEAPELSPIYGQYDNGLNVFPFYDNFAGNTLASFWTSYLNGGTITVNNGLTIQGKPGTFTGYNSVTEIDTATTGAQFSGPSVFDIYLQLGSGIHNCRFGFRDNDLGDVLDGYSGNGIGISIGGPAATTVDFYLTSTASTPSTNSTSITLTLPSYGSANVFSIAATNSIAQYYLNYALASPGTITTNIPQYGHSIGIGIEANYRSTPEHAFWVRTRSYAPDGVMPTVLVNGQTQSPTAPSVTLSSPSVNGLTATINGAAQATSSGATISSISWNWGDGQTTTGSFPQTHSYSASGTYTVSVTATDSNGLTGSKSESVTVVPSGTSTGSQTPAYAFNGAYANYQLTYSYSGYSASGTISYNISGVNTNAQTFSVSTSYGGSLSAYNAFSGTVKASFSSPSPLPAVSPSDLQSLNKGVIPAGMSGSVTTGVSVSVPAGTFSTDEVAASGGTQWIDSSSGLTVKQTGTFMGLMSSTLELQSTNIPSSSSPFSILLVAVIVAIIAVVVVVFLILRRRRPRQKAASGGSATAPLATAPAAAETPPPPAPGTAAPAGAAAALSPEAVQKLQRLKDLLDKGLITQQDFEEQKKKLLNQQ